MGGMGMVFNIAKDALIAQRYSMDVTAHNIANVDTPGYSRQDPVMMAKTSTPVNGLNFGQEILLQRLFTGYPKNILGNEGPFHQRMARLHVISRADNKSFSGRNRVFALHSRFLVLDDENSLSAPSFRKHHNAAVDLAHNRRGFRLTHFEYFGYSRQTAG